jgi:hypothetical protein
MNKGEAIGYLAQIDDMDILEAAVAAAKKKKLEANKKMQRTFKLKKGLSLYFNSTSPYYWVRVAIKDTDGIRRSTKCSGFDEAKQQAYVIEAEVLAYFRSGALDAHKNKSWRNLCWKVIHELRAVGDELVKKGKREPQQLVHAFIIEKKLADRPEWKGKTIHQVGYSQLCDLAESKEFKDPSKTVVNNTKRAISLVFEYARRKDIITREQVPEMPKFKPRDGEEGVPFDIDDREVLLSNLISFYESSRTNFITRLIRRQFPMYFNILMCTGLRTGEEPLGIKWCNIFMGKFELEGKTLNAYSVTITKGKMAKTTVKNKQNISLSRKILINADATNTLERLYYVRYAMHKTIAEIVEEGRDELIFNGHENKKPNFADTFKQYQSYLGKKLKDNYTLYSARHEFINRELDRGMSLQDVADQCGNSPATIHEYYKKYEAINRAGRILTEADIAAFNPETDEENKNQDKKI